jgi:phosphoglycerate dehydrogenase-like enzyme
VTENRLIVSVPGSTLKDAVGAVSNSALPDGVEFIEWDMSGPSPVDTIDIAVPPYMGASDKLVNLAGVTTRLVQSQSIGYDGVDRVLPPGHVYANAATVHETSTAELTLALILASQRGIPNFVRAAEQGHWAPERLQSLADRTVLIVGYGGVGKAVEQRLLPFETQVVRVASVARDDERGRIHGIDELPALLPTADIVVIGVPLNASTTRLVDDKFLSLMPDGALLVNIARGRVVDTDAMLDHARRGRLSVAVDETDPDPLPHGQPL